MKNNYEFQNKTNLVRRVTLFYSFANLLNVWCHWGQLDSHTCFCSWVLVRYMEKTLLQSHRLAKGGLPERATRIPQEFLDHILWGTPESLSGKPNIDRHIQKQATVFHSRDALQAEARWRIQSQNWSLELLLFTDEHPCTSVLFWQLGPSVPGSHSHKEP